jgi:pilus assembly protein CpaE
MSNARENRGKIRVLVVDDISETRENLRKLLYFEDDIEIAGMAASGREGIELAKQLQPDVVLMDINMPGMDGITASEAITSQAPNVQIVMMSVQGEADYLRRSMLAGAREFLIKPFTSEELITSIRRVYQLTAARRAAIPTAPPPTVPATPPPPPKGGRLIAIVGAKGGVGATTIAVNLAIALKAESNARVALVDGSLQLGDVGVLLALSSSRSIADLAGPTPDADEASLNTVLAVHQSGVKVLLAPPRPEVAELVTPEHLKDIFQVMQKMFDYILVDTARQFNDQMLTILDMAEKVILVTAGEIPALKNTKTYFEVTEALKYPDEKTLLVVNKEDGRVRIPAREIAQTLKHPVAVVIANDERTVLASHLAGRPFVFEHRPPPISTSLQELARLIIRAPDEATAQTNARKEKAKGGLFGRR